MKVNPDNFHFIILGNTDSHALQIGEIITKSVSSVTSLGIAIDSSLDFKEHINNFIKKVYYKLYNLGRIRKFLT